MSSPSSFFVFCFFLSRSISEAWEVILIGLDHWWELAGDVRCPDYPVVFYLDRVPVVKGREEGEGMGCCMDERR